VPDEPVQIGLVLDCADPDTLAAFWAAALGYKHLGTADNYALLVPASGSGPKLLLQRVAESKTGKNRMHLDIETPDIEARSAALESLGARRIESSPREEMGHRWIVMADPDGNEFCVCSGGA
jgi:predicted enzyme related to lactoylglutathione lyase